MRALPPLALLVLCAACGGGDGETGSGFAKSCRLQVDLTGDFETRIDFDDRDGCGGAFQDQERVIAFGGLGRPLVRFEVSDIAEDAVGVFSARVVIRDEDGNSWSTPAAGCSIDVTENDYVDEGINGDIRSLRATTECAEPAVADEGNDLGGSVVIGPAELYSCVLCP